MQIPKVGQETFSMAAAFIPFLYPPEAPTVMQGDNGREPLLTRFVDRMFHGSGHSP
jgi:hypothetical protein